MRKFLILAINIEDDRLSRLDGVLGCAVGDLLVKYFGLPHGGNPLQSTFWELVVSKVGKRLDGWRKS